MLTRALVFFLVFGAAPVEAQRETMLVSPTPSEFDRFGQSVAVSGDGSHVAVSAREACEDGSSCGAVHVWARGDDGWVHRARLTAETPRAYARFGSAMALSRDGTRLVVGSPLGRGSVELFGERDDRTWSRLHVFSWEQRGMESFGRSVAIAADGNTVAVGAPFAFRTGAVFVFELRGRRWRLGARFEPGRPNDREQFGYDVALSEDGRTVVATVPGDDGPNDQTYEAGAVILYTLGSRGWSQTSEVRAPSLRRNDFFGRSVDLAANGSRLRLAGRETPRQILTREDNRWVPLGGGGDLGRFESLRLAADGRSLVVRVGDRFHSGLLTTEGTVEVGPPIASPGTTLAVSEHAAVLAIGEPSDDTAARDAGRLRIIEVATPQ